MKSEVPFHKMIPRKNPGKLETGINTCVSLMEQHGKKIPQEHDFLTWSIQNFVRKVKLLENIILLD